MLSWVAAVSTTPLLCALLLKPGGAQSDRDPYAAKPFRMYRAAVQWALHHRLLTIGVVVAMPLIGFPLSNLLFLILFMRLAGLRKKSTLFLTSTLGTLFLLYLFVKVVYLPLPKGGWFFDDLTIWIYRVLHLI